MTTPNEQKFRHRPRCVLYSAFDPLGDVELCSARIPYDARKAADGFFTGYVRHLATAASATWDDVLQGREPFVTVELIWAL